MKVQIGESIFIIIIYLILCLMNKLLHMQTDNTFNLLVSFMVYTVYKDN